MYPSLWLMETLNRDLIHNTLYISGVIQNSNDLFILRRINNAFMLFMGFLNQIYFYSDGICLFDISAYVLANHLLKYLLKPILDVVCSLSIEI
jgi:hypothetical protein